MSERIHCSRQHHHKTVPTYQFKGVTIKVYHSEGRFAAHFVLRNRRYRPDKASEGEALEAAKAKIRKLLDPKEQEAQLEEEVALGILKGLGISVIEACRAYATYVNRLSPLKASLGDAVQYFVAAHQCPPATVDQLVAELLALKKNDTGSHNAKDFRLKLENRFCSSFGPRQIGSIRSDELSRWITAIRRSIRTRRNFYSAIVTLFEYARDNGYLPKGRPTEIHLVKRPKCGKSEIKIFSPDELISLIQAALILGSRALAALLIQAMAGVRHEELEQSNPKKDRLRWRDIRLDQAAPEIHVRDIVSKTKVERFVPIHPALVAWLRLLRGADNAPIYEWMSLTKDYARICKKAGLAWKKNAPRKSYNTYHSALSGSLSVTANAAGNSPEMIAAFYKKELSQVGLQALAWFSISPDKFGVDVALYLQDGRSG